MGSLNEAADMWDRYEQEGKQVPESNIWEADSRRMRELIPGLQKAAKMKQRRMERAQMPWGAHSLTSDMSSRARANFKKYDETEARGDDEFTPPLELEALQAWGNGVDGVAEDENGEISEEAETWFAEMASQDGSEIGLEEDSLDLEELSFEPLNLDEAKSSRAVRDGMTRVGWDWLSTHGLRGGATAAVKILFAQIKSKFPECSGIKWSFDGDKKVVRYGEFENRMQSMFEAFASQKFDFYKNREALTQVFNQWKEMMLAGKGKVQTVETAEQTTLRSDEALEEALEEAWKDAMNARPSSSRINDYLDSSTLAHDGSVEPMGVSKRRGKVQLFHVVRARERDGKTLEESPFVGPLLVPTHSQEKVDAFWDRLVAVLSERLERARVSGPEAVGEEWEAIEVWIGKSRARWMKVLLEQGKGVQRKSHGARDARAGRMGWEEVEAIGVQGEIDELKSLVDAQDLSWATWYQGRRSLEDAYLADVESMQVRRTARENRGLARWAETKSSSRMRPSQFFALGQRLLAVAEPEGRREEMLAVLGAVARKMDGGGQIDASPNK